MTDTLTSAADWLIEAMARAITFWTTMGGHLPWWTPAVAIPLGVACLAVYLAAAVKLDEMRDRLSGRTEVKE